MLLYRYIAIFTIDLPSIRKVSSLFFNTVSLFSTSGYFLFWFIGPVLWCKKCQQKLKI